MLEHAKVPAGVRLLEGSAEAIPAPDGTADFLTLGYALRHISDLDQAFAEFYRVLRPGGRVCLLEITLPEGRMSRALLRAWLGGFVPKIATLVARRRDTPLLMNYYWDTIAACVPPGAILAALAGAGFVAAERHTDLSVFSVYCARKPAGSVARPGIP